MKARGKWCVPLEEKKQGGNNNTVVEEEDGSGVSDEAFFLLCYDYHSDSSSPPSFSSHKGSRQDTRTAGEPQLYYLPAGGRSDKPTDY